MPTTRRDFCKAAGITSLGIGLAGIGACELRRPGTETAEPRLLPLEPPFRLDEGWYRQTLRRLQERMGERGYDGMIFSDRWNIIYFTGLFHTSTERPFWLFIPTQGNPTFFAPGLDRDLIETWWIGDFEWYFDFPHHGPSNQIVYEPGEKVDLLQWMLRGLARRGHDRSTLALEAEAAASTLRRMQEILPRAVFKAEERLPIEMRRVKTPEEIALTQKAIDLHDRMLDFARSYILEHGTDATDFEVRHAAEEYGTGLLMEGLKVDGRPHNGVGIDLGFGCRAGLATAYPHPNQFFYHRIRAGEAVQIAALIRVGGYGGEGYRALHIEPIPDLGRRMWEVHTEMAERQAELCRAGTRCNEVASQVLSLAREADLERYVYHRPAHGEGMEGHQEPYISLGDETTLEANMMLSNEPGLYNPADGYGYNHSNNILVGRDRGIRMNKTPMTKEWCWIRV